MMTTSELVVGQNRLAFGLLKRHQLIEEADVVVRVYELDGQQAHLKAQMRAPYARLEIVQQGKRVYIHPDGTQHVHNEEIDVRGVYVTQVEMSATSLHGFGCVILQNWESAAPSRSRT